MLYKLFFRPIASLLGPEQAGKLALSSLSLLDQGPLGRSLLKLRYRKRDHRKLSTELFGLTFPNPVGLAAGMDRSGKYCGCLSDLGFGFIEVGSITADPESGFKKPRVSRLAKDRAIIHRCGAPNPGVMKVLENLQENRRRGSIVALSLTASLSSTKDSLIIDDYRRAFSMSYDFADLFVINLSAPNQNGVLTVQDSASLAEIVDPLLDLRACYGGYKPILIKVATDIPYAQLDDIIDYCRISGVDGIIAGNSPKANPSVLSPTRKLLRISGGSLSGQPIFEQSLALVKHIHEYTDGRFPIIGCGGIMSPGQARSMFLAGASLIQLYTGLVYNGPSLLRRILKYLEK